MDNYQVSKILSLYANLSELHNENPFKVKAFRAAAFNIKKQKEPLEDLSMEQIAALPAVGKTVLSSVKSILEESTFPGMISLMAITPVGVVEMLQIKGLGPKKVEAIWKGMGLETVEDLFEAARENRLVAQPGFGLKTQAEIMRAIEFSLASKGDFHFARAEKPAETVLKHLQEHLPGRHAFAGDFRRHANTLSQVDLLSTANADDLDKAILALGFEAVDVDQHIFENEIGLRFVMHHVEEKNFDKKLFTLTGNQAHLDLLGFIDDDNPFEGEEALYASMGKAFIIPEMREGQHEFDFAAKYSNDYLLEYGDLKGILHNHSTYSDGLHSLGEMAEYCSSLGYEYLGICDHSKSAAYAGGLSEDRVREQWAEIDRLNAGMAPFKIFKGIESDILGDGSLDYPPDFLAGFDFVVASVHSNLKMNEEKANNRLKIAIENPYTTILGHPTGRLLLVREGYPIDHAYIIDACAANGVSIELNANPFRLDLDWSWIWYAMEKGVMISINPDAHAKEGYHDMHFGTLSARKGGLTKAMTLNAMSLSEIEKYFATKKNSRSIM